MAAGTVLGWTSNISNKLKDGDLNDIDIDDGIVGWIGSWMTLGAMLMCFPIGYICDTIGRKLSMLLTIIPFTGGWLLIIFATNEAMIYVGRFLTGLAGGAFCVAAPLYTSEIAQKEIRGALGGYFQLLLTVGILMSNILGAYMSVVPFTIVCAVVPFVFGVIFFLQPETPVYLMMKGKEEEAKNSLRRLRGSNYNCDEELKEIKDNIEASKENKISVMESLKTTAAKKAVFICFGLMFFQQLSGINAVIFYTGDIFSASGSNLDAKIATIIVGVVQVLATFLSSIIVDKFGRKVLLILSDFFMMVAGLLLAIYFTLSDRDVLDDDQIKSIGFLPVVSLVVFIALFSLGFGPIPWVASSELFPSEIKANASSAAATFNWFLAFIVTKFYNNLIEAIGNDSPFYIFSGVSLVGTLFVFFFVPETKGKSHAEVQRMLNGEKENSSSSSKDGFDNPTFQQ